MLVWNNNKPVLSESDILLLGRMNYIRSTSGEDLIDIRLEEGSKVIVKTVINGKMSWKASMLRTDLTKPVSISEVRDVKDTITRLIG